MFIGEYTHTIDEKGRVSIPAKYRGRLADSLVITRGLDRCLWVYPNSEWEKIAERLAGLPISQKKSRALGRLLLAGAWDTSLDAQGRVVLPGYLREYAKLSKQVTIAGLFNKIEMWDEDAWHEYRGWTEEAGEEIAESMAGLGI